MALEANWLHRPPSLLCRILLMQTGDAPCTCGVMIRKSALDITGGFGEGFPLYEDQTLWVKVFLRFPVIVSDYRVSRYRQHDNSGSANAEREGLYSPWGPPPPPRVCLRLIP